MTSSLCEARGAKSLTTLNTWALINFSACGHFIMSLSHSMQMKITLSFDVISSFFIGLWGFFTVCKEEEPVISIAPSCLARMVVSTDFLLVKF